jgi:predicted Zn finger-like uncharacterized protein
MLIEGKQAVNYRVIDCPHCNRAQMINNRLIVDQTVQTVRCPWCNEVFTYDFSPLVGITMNYYVVEV